MQVLKKALVNSPLFELSPEIKYLFDIADPLLGESGLQSPKLVPFVISLDFLAKGLTNHLIIKENEKSGVIPDKEQPKATGWANYLVKFKRALSLNNMLKDIKVPLLLGDIFHTKAYYMTSQLGVQELCHILSCLDENFSRMPFALAALKPTSDFKEIHNSLFYFLPNFYRHTLRGVSGLIASKNTMKSEHLQKIGEYLGYYRQYFEIAKTGFTMGLNSRARKIQNPLETGLTSYFINAFWMAMTNGEQNKNLARQIADHSMYCCFYCGEEIKKMCGSLGLAPHLIEETEQILYRPLLAAIGLATT